MHEVHTAPPRIAWRWLLALAVLRLLLHIAGNGHTASIATSWRCGTTRTGWPGAMSPIRR